jgi:hypothetical protein
MSDEDKRIRELYEKHGGNVRAVATELGLDTLEVAKVMVPITVRVQERRPLEPIGRVALRKYQIAFRHSTNTSWSVEDMPAILAARKRYDAGTHEVFQEKTEGWYILYCKPRRQQTANRHWFSTMGDF